MNKRFLDKISDKIVERFPDNVQINSLFEIAQTMLDAGKEPKEIKKILKDLYGASKEELERMEEKLFKNKVNAEIHPDAVLTELQDIEADLKDFEAIGLDGDDLTEALQYYSMAKNSLSKLIKELEGDRGTRQEGSTEKHADIIGKGGTWYNGPLIFKKLQEVRGHVELGLREPGTEEATGHTQEALEILDHMIAELDESKDELAD